MIENIEVMIDKSYVTVAESIKEQIRSANHKAILNANKEMLILYWNIGKVINEHSTWGSKFLKNLSEEIKNEFPSAKGFSVSNLKNMVRFYREYSNVEIGQSVTAQITWTHNIEVLRVESKEQRLWYINKTIENGWSVNVLAHQIDTNLYLRQKEQKKVSNFVINPIETRAKDMNQLTIDSNVDVKPLKDFTGFTLLDEKGIEEFVKTEGLAMSKEGLIQLISPKSF